MSSTLRMHRESRGLSVSELAQRAGIERTHIYRLERGENSPTLTTLTKIGRALDLHPAALLLGRSPR